MTYTMILSIAKSLTDDISGKLTGSGIMFRIFSRVKTVNSIRHKVEVKYAGRKSATKIQDVLSLFFGTGDIVKKSIDDRPVPCIIDIRGRRFLSPHVYASDLTRRLLPLWSRTCPV